MNIWPPVMTCISVALIIAKRRSFQVPLMLILVTLILGQAFDFLPDL